MLKIAGALSVALLALLALPFTAAAAPPANDNRDNAQPITLPANVTGTTVDSTRENLEPGEICQSGAGSVWYSLTATSSGRVAFTLQAQGKLDAGVEVFRVRRSQLDELDCDQTNDSESCDVDGA